MVLNFSARQIVKYVFQEILFKKIKLIICVDVIFSLFMFGTEFLIANKYLAILLSILISIPASISLVYIALSSNDNLTNDFKNIIKAIQEGFFQLLTVKLFYIGIALLFAFLLFIIFMKTQFLGGILGIIIGTFMLIIFDFATYMSILKHLKPVAAFKEGYAKAKQYWKLIVKIYLLMMLIQLVVLLPVILISGFSLYSQINNSTGIQPDIMILLSEMLLPIIFFKIISGVLSLMKDFCIITICIDSIKKSDENFIQSS